ncbi:hypothetical protein NFI96_030915, partial [Prochilodus magdalenae]
VKCFHRSSPSQREVVFRLQFHTGAVQDYSLMFEKEDMEQANRDPRFPDYGKVELVFSEGPERIQGAELWQNGADVSVDYSATDSLTRWDSYQDICNGEDCHGVTQNGSGSSSVTSPALVLEVETTNEAVWRHRGQSQDEPFVVTRPEGLVSLHLHPYRTICRNCVRIFELHGMDYHRTPLGTSTAPYRDICEPGSSFGRSSPRPAAHSRSAMLLSHRLNGWTKKAPPLQPQVSTLDKFSPKRSQIGSVTLGRSTRTTSVTSSPEHSDHGLSASSDSGLSSTSLWTERGPASGGKSAGPSQQEKAELNRLLSGFGLDEPQTDDGMEPRSTSQGVLHHQTVHANGGIRPKERETDILDDEVMMSGHDLRSVDSLGTLSSSYHKSSQNSLLSDGFCSPGVVEDIPHHAPAAMEEYERAYAEARRNCLAKRTVSLPVSTTSSSGSKAQQFRQGSYSTQTWVRQQQMVAALHYSYLPEEGGVEENFNGDKQEILPKVTNDDQAVSGSGTSHPKESPRQDSDKSHDEEFNSLTVDIDNSIDQLNQLILDLDPTFVPIPTRTNSVKRNGATAARSNNGLTLRLSENNRSQQPAGQPTGESLRSLSRQGSEVGDHPALTGRAAWEVEQEFGDRLTYTHGIPSAQRPPLYRADSVEYRGPGAGLDSGVDTGSDITPPTPAFPVSPPTPYVKNMPDLSHFAQTPTPSMPLFGAYRTEHDMRAYGDIMGHDEGMVNSSNRTFTRSVTTGGVITLTDSPSQASCSEGALLSRHFSLNTQRSAAVDFSQNSPPSHHPHALSHPAPNAHSSPRGSQRTRAAQYSLSRSPVLNEPDGFSPPSGPSGFAPEADSLSYQFQQPPLPEKRRTSDCERSLGSASPAPSGFSSPHSGSSLSIPFPNVLPELHGRTSAGPPSPLPGELHGLCFCTAFQI